MLVEGRVGPLAIGDGSTAEPRLAKDTSVVVQDGHARFQEAVYRGRVWTLTLAATTTGVAAGNIVGAAAAASTQFAVWNPRGSNFAAVLWRLAIGIISGTPGAGPLFHCGMIDHGVSVASSGGAPTNNLVGSSGAPSLKYQASAAGAALTGGSALTTLGVADFTSTATAQASVSLIKAVEYIDGAIVLPPGTGYVPCWGAAGTSLLNGYSLSWEEISYP